MIFPGGTGILNLILISATYDLYYRNKDHVSVIMYYLALRNAKGVVVLWLSSSLRWPWSKNRISGRAIIFQGVNTPSVAMPLWVTFREYCRLLRAYGQVCPCLFLTRKLARQFILYRTLLSTPAFPVTNRGLQLEKAACRGIFMPFSVVQIDLSLCKSMQTCQNHQERSCCFMILLFSICKIYLNVSEGIY